MKFEILDTDIDFVFAAHGPLFLAIWRAAPAMLGVRRIGLALERHAKAWPGGIAIAVVIEPSARPPASDARELMARDMKKHEKFTRCIALVIEGEGFRIAAIRAVLGAMLLMSKQSAPTHVFPTAGHCAAWLAQQEVLKSLTTSELIETMTKARGGGV